MLISDKISAMRFKCCLHCLPQEEEQYLHGRLNRQGRETVDEFHFYSGLASPFPHDISRRMNVSGLELDENEHIRTLQTLFAKRFPSRQHSAYKFNWPRVSGHIWKGVSQVTKDLKCPGRHSCDFYQLVGTCGELTVKLPYPIVDEEALS